MIKFSKLNEASAKERSDARMNMASKAAASRAGTTTRLGDISLKHRVSVTVSDPQHTGVSKRNNKVERRVRVLAGDEKSAVQLARDHFKKLGYKVHDANWIGIHENIDGIIEQGSPEYDMHIKGMSTYKDIVNRHGRSKTIDIISRLTKERNSLRRHSSDWAGPAHLKKHDMAITGLKKALGENTSSNEKDAEESNINEAVKVEKRKYSWGKMITVHDGARTSFPLHPEHQKEITKLKDGDKTSFKDETGKRVHVHRVGDRIHLTTKDSNYKPTTVHYSHFDEATSAYGRIDARFKKLSGRTLGAAAKEHGDEAKKLQKEIEAQQKEIDRRKAAMKNEESLDELSKSTLGSYVKKASTNARINSMISKDFDHKAMTSRKPSTRDAFYGLSSKFKTKSWKRSDNVSKAVDRLTKEEVDPTHKKILNKAKTSVPKAPKSDYERKVASYLKKKYSEEVEQVDEASLTAGKRLISKHGEGSHTTRVYKDTEYNEYQVHHYKDGKHMGEGPVSYHDDKEDAENTAKMSLRRQTKEEQIDELDKSTIKSYLKKKISKPGIPLQKDVDGIGRATVRLMKREEVKIDELNQMTLSRYAAKARSQSMDKNNPKRYKRGSGAAQAYDKLNRGDYSEEVKDKDEIPFTPDKPKPPSAKAGKYGLGYSTAKHLARMALAQQTKKKQDKNS